ncbi:protein TMED8 [Latimeria chalumnae]|uniref:protein TMED8 n=1 Tax=Latimeria chalumnae TaxID=7897 RepID=UPI00313CFF0A
MASPLSAASLPSSSSSSWTGTGSELHAGVDNSKQGPGPDSPASVLRGERSSSSLAGQNVETGTVPTSQFASLSLAETPTWNSENRPQIVPPLNEDPAKTSGKGGGNQEDQSLKEQDKHEMDQLQNSQEDENTALPQHPVQNLSSDSVVMQSDHAGTRILVVETALEDESKESGKGPPPPLAPPTTWSSKSSTEFKAKMRGDKNAVVIVSRGEVVTVHVPTHPEGKRISWEFATDNYDIGFGVYFDWTPVTSTAISVQVSDWSDEEDEEEEIEGVIPVGDVEKGSRNSPRSHFGEIMPVYRRDSHLEVQAGSHDYPGEGVYLLKFDNSYSLWRNKTLYYHVYYT